MYVSEIKNWDIANGPGVRVSLFVSGCTHHCKGCFNEMTWDFTYGRPYAETDTRQILSWMKSEYIAGLTLLGGEPMEYVNQQGLLPLVRAVKERFPHKTIWCYTGYLFERDLLQDFCVKWKETKELLGYLDVIVDGEFVLEKKNISLPFRGSENQRIILVQESLREGRTILLDA